MKVLFHLWQTKIKKICQFQSPILDLMMSKYVKKKCNCSVPQLLCLLDKFFSEVPSYFYSIFACSVTSLLTRDGKKFKYSLLLIVTFTINIIQHDLQLWLQSMSGTMIGYRGLWSTVWWSISPNTPILFDRAYLTFLSCSNRSSIFIHWNKTESHIFIFW